MSTRGIVLTYFLSPLFVVLRVSQYLFVDSTNNYLWNTFDFCKSVQGFSLPFKPTDLLLHSRSSNLVLGYDGSHPNKQVQTGLFFQIGCTGLKGVHMYVYYIVGVVWRCEFTYEGDTIKRKTP